MWIKYNFNIFKTFWAPIIMTLLARVKLETWFNAVLGTTSITPPITVRNRSNWSKFHLLKTSGTVCLSNYFFIFIFFMYSFLYKVLYACFTHHIDCVNFPFLLFAACSTHLLLSIIIIIIFIFY